MPVVYAFTPGARPNAAGPVPFVLPAAGPGARPPAPLPAGASWEDTFVPPEMLGAGVRHDYGCSLLDAPTAEDITPGGFVLRSVKRVNLSCLSTPKPKCIVLHLTPRWIAAVKPSIATSYAVHLSLDDKDAKKPVRDLTRCCCVILSRLFQCAKSRRNLARSIEGQNCRALSRFVTLKASPPPHLLVMTPTSP
jgi:hypothetical protein